MNMTAPKYLMAYSQKQNEYHLEVTAIVLLGMVSEDGDVIYLEIRYQNYDAGIVEGDHLFLSLDEALISSEAHFGICREHWRDLSAHEIENIDQGIS